MIDWPSPSTTYSLTIAALLAAITTASPSLAARRLTLDGLDHVRFGMTVVEIERQLGSSLIPEPAEAAEPCWYGVRADRSDAGVAYMIEHGRLTRIDVSRARDGAKPDVGLPNNIAIGSTRAALAGVYGRALRERRSDSNPGQTEVRVARAKGRSIMISLSSGRVVSLRSGLSASVDYPEGCS